MRKLTAAERAAFLEALARGHTVLAAAKIIGHGRSTLYDLRRTDAEFAKAWEGACADSAELLEEVAFQRAVEGVERKLFYQGVEVGVVREYNDNLLVQLLRVRAPARWGNRLKVDASLEVDIAAEILAARKRAGLPAVTPAPEESPAASLSQDIVDARARAGLQAPQTTETETDVDPFS
ncbi:MAG TPA: hypothetical protein PJ986_04610 [Gammaproteobacteria bacterium]|nr:hypothetical protein [Gammaproteobacteria bacterium]